jgi:hypothetical protein
VCACCARLLRLIGERVAALCHVDMFDGRSKIMCPLSTLSKRTLVASLRAFPATLYRVAARGVIAHPLYKREQVNITGGV